VLWQVSNVVLDGDTEIERMAGATLTVAVDPPVVLRGGQAGWPGPPQ
jgi:hypothetical protein